MFNLFKASLYKLFREKTFLITLIIGTVLAIIIPLITHLVVEDLGGEYMFVSSVTIGSNFGLTVPINLAVMTVAEFTTGTLRNKVIAGYRKSKIYVSLLLSGLVFTIILMAYYIALNTIMGTILGGFDANRIGGADFILPFIAITFACYIFVTTLSIFVATSVRNIGASISIIVIFLVFISLVPTIMMFSDNEAAIKAIQWIDPIYVLNEYSSSTILVGLNIDKFKDCIAPGIVSPLFYSALFVVLGMVEFSHRDIK